MKQEFHCVSCRRHLPMTTAHPKPRPNGKRVCTTCYERIQAAKNRPENQRLRRGKFAAEQYAKGKAPVEALKP